MLSSARLERWDRGQRFHRHHQDYERHLPILMTSEGGQQHQRPHTQHQQPRKQQQLHHLDQLHHGHHPDARYQFHGHHQATLWATKAPQQKLKPVSVHFPFMQNYISQCVELCQTWECKARKAKALEKRPFLKKLDPEFFQSQFASKHLLGNVQSTSNCLRHIKALGLTSKKITLITPFSWAFKVISDRGEELFISERKMEFRIFEERPHKPHICLMHGKAHIVFNRTHFFEDFSFKCPEKLIALPKCIVDSLTNKYW